MTAALIDTLFGVMKVEFSEGSISALRFVEDGVDEGFQMDRAAVSQEDAVTIAGLIKWIRAYEKGERDTLDELPFISLTGTPFQMAVWKATTEIPPGETMTYGELARAVEDNLRRVGRRGRVTPRSIGTALSKNPVLLLIPCHRIVGVGHRLTGYSGGIERKAQLLEHEQKIYGKNGESAPSLFGI